MDKNLHQIAKAPMIALIHQKNIVENKMKRAFVLLLLLGLMMPLAMQAQDFGNTSRVSNCRIPTDFQASEITPQSVVLSWTENGEATEWIVAYKTVEDNGFTEVNATENPFTLTGLTPETEYSVKVKPVCDVDDKWSNEIQFTTLEACPAPENLQVDNLAATTATLSWIGFSQDYVVRYRTSIYKGGRGATAGEWETLSATEPTITLTNLMPETTYEAQVQGDCGDEGLSEFSETITFTTGLFDGSGTEDDPYLIFITEQMDELAASVNGGDYKTGLYFRLEADLDYSGKTYTPVGTIAKWFNGNFNGNGHSITNVTLNAGYETDIGVFGMVDTDGTVQNLTLDQSSIVGGDFVGGIAGGCYGSVLNCTVGTNVSVTGNNYVGGIVGDCHGSVLNCTVGTDVSLTGNDYVGGIAGRCEGSVLNCTVGTNISLTGSNDVGGIVGWFAGGTISDCVNAAPVIGAGEVGGIIGTSSFRVPSVQGQITSCRNSGRIESTDFFCGGIGGKFAGKGYLGHPNFTVTGCANTGEVIGYKTVGGIVGMSYYTIVSDCMNQGRITAPAQIPNYEQKIGGVIGRLDPGCTISNNYYTGDYYYYEDELGNEQTGQLGGINFQDVTNQAMRGYTIEAYAPLAISLEGSIGLTYEGKVYAGNGQDVVVSLEIQDPSLAPQCYIPSAGTLVDNGNDIYTITMPAEDITISGNIVEFYGTYYEIPCDGGITATVIYDASYTTKQGISIEDFEYLGKQYTVTAIAEGAFDGCDSIIYFDCHSNISTIGDHAMRNCTGINYFGFYHTPTPPTLGEGVFEGLGLDTLWLMVPFCSQYDYSTHPVWGQFGTVFPDGECEYNFINMGGDKLWSNPDNWAEGEVPVAGAQVGIMSDCEMDTDVTIGSITIGNYYDEYYGLYERLTVKSGNTLTASNFIYTTGDERNFVIEDGAQVYHPNAGAKATVEKNITAYNTTGGTNNGWHLIGSPATESFAPSVNNGFLANEYDLYFYDEPTHYWRNYKPNGQYAGFYIEPLKGYLYANSANDTLSLTGTLRPATETVTKPLSYTDGIELAGFNLVGNPFAHNVTDFTGSNVADEIYRMNGTKDNLMVSVIDGDNPLKPGEGFFVKATAEDATITFNSRATNAERSNITLEVSENGLIVDRFILKRDGEPLEKFTLNENSTKIYATEDGQDWAVAVIASEAKQSSPTEQALNFKAAKNGTYTLNVNVENMDLDYLHLIDNMTGADVDMLASPTYTFTANTADYASRFRLVFSAQDNADDDNDAPFAYINNGNIVITTDVDDATLQVMDMTGRVIVSHDGHTRYIPTTGMPAGVYVLRLIDGDSVRTQKMVIE